MGSTSWPRQRRSNAREPDEGNSSGLEVGSYASGTGCEASCEAGWVRGRRRARSWCDQQCVSPPESAQVLTYSSLTMCGSGRPGGHPGQKRSISSCCCISSSNVIGTLSVDRDWDWGGSCGMSVGRDIGGFIIGMCDAGSVGAPSCTGASVAAWAY